MFKNKIFIISLLALTFIFIFKFLLLLDKGFDLTDESYYLLYIKNPFSYMSRVSSFGFFYNPIYRLFDGDLFLLRLTNVVIIYSLSYFLLAQGIKKIMLDNLTSLLVLVLATVGLQFFFYGLITPSYNSLNITGILIVAIALLRFSVSHKHYIALSVLTGCGGAVVFLAKPSSAALIVIWCLIFLVVNKQKCTFRYIALAISVSFFILLLFFALLDSGFDGALSNVQRGLELGGLLDGGKSVNDIFRLDRFWFSSELYMFSFLLTLIGFFTSLSYSIASTFLSGFLRGILLLIIVLIVFGYIPIQSNHYFSNLIIITVPLYTVGYLCFYYFYLKHKVDIKMLLSGIMLFGLPYVYVFGTNGNYWYQANAASVFWVLGSIYLINSISVAIEQKKRYLITISAMSLIVLGSTVYQIDNYPYRQEGPMSSYDKKVDHGDGVKFIHTSEVRSYFRKIIMHAEKSSFKEGDRLIDLSGRSPGVTYVLGGRGFALPWNIGGYTGSFAKLVNIFDNSSCEAISEAWLLIEENGPRSISVDVLGSFGADLSRYEKVGYWLAPAGYGGADEDIVQSLFKPKAKDSPLSVLGACRVFRGARNNLD